MFTDPAVFSIGLTPDHARERDVDLVTRSFDVDRASLTSAAAGNGALTEAFVDSPYLAACGVWKVPAADASVHRPVTVAIPILVMLGQFDPFASP